MGTTTNIYSKYDIDVGRTNKATKKSKIEKARKTTFNDFDK